MCQHIIFDCLKFSADPNWSYLSSRFLQDTFRSAFDPIDHNLLIKYWLTQCSFLQNYPINEWASDFFVYACASCCRNFIHTYNIWMPHACSFLFNRANVAVNNKNKLKQNATFKLKACKSKSIHIGNASTLYVHSVKQHTTTFTVYEFDKFTFCWFVCFLSFLLCVDCSVLTVYRHCCVCTVSAAVAAVDANAAMIIFICFHNFPFRLCAHFHSQCEVHSTMTVLGLPVTSIMSIRRLS